MITGAAADWRDAAAYRPLWRCDRAMLAWEWLRRDPDYRKAAAGGDHDMACRFGLLRIEPAGIGVPNARPFWRAAADPAVLRAAVIDSGDVEGFALGSLAELAMSHRHGGGEHLLLSDGYQALRIDIAGGAITGARLRLRWELAGLEELVPRIDALQRLIACHRRGRFGAPTHPTRVRARRLAVLLRVRDALLDEATTREIATALYGVDLAGPGWRTMGASWRARAQRLVANVRSLARAGPAAMFRLP